MLHALGDRSARIGQQEWIEARRAAYAERLAADPFEGRFVAQALRPRWLPDFMCRPPRDADQTFGDELRRVREAPLDVALADLAEGGATADWLEVPDLAARVADLLEWVWTHCVEPDWERRRRIFEADIVARTQQLSGGGWAAALSGLRQEMVWLGDGKLCINAYDNPPRDLTGARLLFIPTTAPRGWVSHDMSDTHAITYPCHGLLAEPDHPAPQALQRLIGPVRARILVFLDSPMNTSQLVALSGHGLGTIGNHLKVLLDARLVRRRRSGRTVLYYRTAAGDHLVTAQRDR